MPTSKYVPPTTDPTFAYRVPAFIVVYGICWHYMHGFQKRIISKGGRIASYQKHGQFQLEWCGPDCGVVKHTTLSGKEMYIFIPQGKMMSISNGSWRMLEVNYDSYKITYRSSHHSPYHFSNKQVRG